MTVLTRSVSPVTLLFALKSVTSSGGLAEWLMAAVLKTAIGESLSRVRIPHPPPKLFARDCFDGSVRSDSAR